MCIHCLYASLVQSPRAAEVVEGKRKLVEVCDKVGAESGLRRADPLRTIYNSLSDGQWLETQKLSLLPTISTDCK